MTPETCEADSLASLEERSNRPSSWYRGCGASATGRGAAAARRRKRSGWRRVKTLRRSASRCARASRSCSGRSTS